MTENRDTLGKQTMSELGGFHCIVLLHLLYSLDIYLSAFAITYTYLVVYFASSTIEIVK